jgi:hypothetical protein
VFLAHNLTTGGPALRVSMAPGSIEADQAACYRPFVGMLKRFPVAVSPGFDRRASFSQPQSNERGPDRVYPVMGELSHG